MMQLLSPLKTQGQCEKYNNNLKEKTDNAKNILPEGVGSVKNYTNAHVQTQLNQVFNFFLDVFIFIQNCF